MICDLQKGGFSTVYLALYIPTKEFCVVRHPETFLLLCQWSPCMTQSTPTYRSSISILEQRTLMIEWKMRWRPWQVSAGDLWLFKSMRTTITAETTSCSTTAVTTVPIQTTPVWCWSTCLGRLCRTWSVAGKRSPKRKCLPSLTLSSARWAGSLNWSSFIETSRSASQLSITSLILVLTYYLSSLTAIQHTGRCSRACQADGLRQCLQLGLQTRFQGRGECSLGNSKKHVPGASFIGGLWW